jgi:hypothetical protein
MLWHLQPMLALQVWGAPARSLHAVLRMAVAGNQWPRAGLVYAAPVCIVQFMLRVSQASSCLLRVGRSILCWRSQGSTPEASMTQAGLCSG